MSRFILRFRGKGTKPTQDVERIRALPDTEVLRDSSRMILVEAPEAELKAAVASMPQWMMTEERVVSLPDPRPKLRHEQ